MKNILHSLPVVSLFVATPGLTLAQVAQGSGHTTQPVGGSTIQVLSTGLRPDGNAALRVTVPAEEAPPMTPAGLSIRENSVIDCCLLPHPPPQA